MAEVRDLEEERLLRDIEPLIKRIQNGYGGIPIVDGSIHNGVQIVHFLAPDQAGENVNLNFLVCDKSGTSLRAIGLVRLTAEQCVAFREGLDEMMKALETAYEMAEAKAASEP